VQTVATEICEQTRTSDARCAVDWIYPGADLGRQTRYPPRCFPERCDGGAAAATAVSGGKAQDFPGLESAARRKFCSPDARNPFRAYSERPHGSDEVASEVGVDSAGVAGDESAQEPLGHTISIVWSGICAQLPDRACRPTKHLNAAGYRRRLGCLSGLRQTQCRRPAVEARVFHHLPYGIFIFDERPISRATRVRRRQNRTSPAPTPK
jgi:hypothetical protein